MSTRSGTQTRAIAIDALTHILTRKIHADTALNKLFSFHKDLRQLDRAFIFEMVYGSLRWLSKMDWIMSHMIDRPFTSLDVRVVNALRIGTYQIYYMDKVPDRAAVSETVEALKVVGAGNASSFVNAVLRRVARKAEYFPKPDKVKNPADYYAMHYSHPKWMVERWMRHIQGERLEYFFTGNNTPPVNSVRIIKSNPLPTNEDVPTYLLRNYGISSSWRPLKNTIQLEKLPPFDNCEAFKAGCYVIQDEAAQLATSLIQPSPQDKILDACAAPGGKLIYLWDEGVSPENLFACDFSIKRIGVLKENLQRMQISNIHVEHADTIEYVKNKTFNKIILDAPCSSLGVIRRHPEIKWLRTPQEIEKNVMEQERLLNGLAPAVADNGELIYIVCSVELEETTMQINKFLHTHPEFSIVNLDGRIHDYYRKYLTNSSELLIIPGNADRLDGFYAVVLKKKHDKNV